MKQTSEGNEDSGSYIVHSRYTMDELRARHNHRGAAENVVDEVEHDKHEMSNLAIAHPNYFERCMSIRDSNLGHNTECCHQCNLEA